MVDFVDRLPWTILNDGRPTRHRHVLDVCMVNPPATTIFTNWSPLEEDINDHWPCLIETEHTTPVREATQGGTCEIFI